MLTNDGKLTGLDKNGVIGTYGATSRRQSNRAGGTRTTKHGQNDNAHDWVRYSAW